MPGALCYRVKQSENCLPGQTVCQALISPIIVSTALNCEFDHGPLSSEDACLHAVSQHPIRHQIHPHVTHRYRVTCSRPSHLHYTKTIREFVMLTSKFSPLVKMFTSLFLSASQSRSVPAQVTCNL